MTLGNNRIRSSQDLAKNFHDLSLQNCYILLNISQVMCLYVVNIFCKLCGVVIPTICGTKCADKFKLTSIDINMSLKIHIFH